MKLKGVLGLSREIKGQNLGENVLVLDTISCQQQNRFPQTSFSDLCLFVALEGICWGPLKTGTSCCILCSRVQLRCELCSLPKALLSWESVIDKDRCEGWIHAPRPNSLLPPSCPLLLLLLLMYFISSLFLNLYLSSWPAVITATPQSHH